MTIFCVEPELAILEGRCAVLRSSSYEAVGKTPQFAEVVLSSRMFDLVVISNLSDHQRDRLINLADGAERLVLEEGLTMPSDLLHCAADRLSRRRA